MRYLELYSIMCYNCKKEGSDEMLSHKDFYYLSKVISDSCTQCIPLGYDELPDDESSVPMNIAPGIKEVQIALAISAGVV